MVPDVLGAQPHGSPLSGVGAMRVFSKRALIEREGSLVRGLNFPPTIESMETNREHMMQETPTAVNSRVMGRQFFTAGVTSKNDSNHISLKELTKLSDLSMSAARKSARARDRKTADKISSNSVLQTEGQSEKIQLFGGNCSETCRDAGSVDAACIYKCFYG